MSHLPTSLTNSLIDVEGFNKDLFEKVHAEQAAPVSIRFNTSKISHFFTDRINGKGYLHELSPLDEKIPWSSNGYYLKERPSFTFDPLFHAGLYYVQEASSMFLEQAIKQTTDLRKDIKVLDLCAAPGGKSTLIRSLISPGSLLVANEVIKSRALILEENLCKWGASNYVVTNNDPKDFSRLEQFFDLMVVDAPCSGSGLFRRDPEAISEWSENNVALCSQRQQRILHDCWAALKNEGVLIYSTCSYSREEDEMILEWMLSNFDAEAIKLEIDSDWNIVESVVGRNKAYGYRFWPHRLKGEGFFVCCMRKREPEKTVRRNSKHKKFEKVSKTEEAVISPWIKPGYQLLKQGDSFFAWQQSLEDDLQWIASQSLYIKQAGIRLGKLAGKDLIPDHALAMSTILSEKVVVISLKYEQAIQYLKKEEVPIDQLETGDFKGWSLVSFNKVPLGWVKILANRMNNYYPREWRILKK